LFKLKQPKNKFYPKVTAMFPLFQKEAPANAKQLADALSASLRHVLEIARDPVDLGRVGLGYYGDLQPFTPTRELLYWQSRIVHARAACSGLTKP
jgi:hypothetical protein